MSGIQWGLFAFGMLSLIFIWIGFLPIIMNTTDRDRYGGKSPPHEYFHQTKENLRPPRRMARLRSDLQILNRGEEILQHILRLQWFVGSFTFMAGFILWVWRLSFWWLVVGVIASWVMTRWPMWRVHQQAQMVRDECERELPLLQLSLLQRILAGQSPYEAVREASQSLSGPFQQEMRQLVADMEMTGDVEDAWKRWAERMDFPSALRFAALLQQTLTVNTVGVDRQLRAVYQALRREQQDSWQRKARQLPGRLQWPNLILFANMVLLPVIGVGFGLSRILYTF